MVFIPLSCSQVGIEENLRRQIPQHLSGIVVDPLLNLGNLFVGVLLYRRAFGDKPPDDAVCVLIGAPFPGAVGMAVIDLGSVALPATRALNAGRVHKLAAIVYRDGPEHLLESGP